jgi:methylmalonyl-CoA mutase
MLYEQGKHDGTLPLVGVNTFLAPDRGDQAPAPGPVALARSTEQEKRRQLRRLAEFQARHAAQRPAALDRLRHAALAGDNLFGVLIDVVPVCSLGEITDALFEVGGRYRRNV